MRHNFILLLALGVFNCRSVSGDSSLESQKAKVITCTADDSDYVVKFDLNNQAMPTRAEIYSNINKVLKLAATNDRCKKVNALTKNQKSSIQCFNDLVKGWGFRAELSLDQNNLRFAKLYQIFGNTHPEQTISENMSCR